MGLDEFRRLLAETVAWCHRHASESDPAGSLRTPALRPANLGHIPNRWGNFDYEWGTQERNQGAVSALAQRRAELLRAGHNYPEAVPTEWVEGRLLIAAPLESDACGLSGPESKGFIDGLDIPAWDTWLCHVEEPTLPDAEQTRRGREEYRAAYGMSGWGPWRRVREGFVDWRPPASVSHLLCWIPQPFLGLVEDGISVNPVGCIFWAVDYKRQHYNTRLMQQLDAADWLR